MDFKINIELDEQETKDLLETDWKQEYPKLHDSWSLADKGIVREFSDSMGCES